MAEHLQNPRESGELSKSSWIIHRRHHMVQLLYKTYTSLFLTTEVVQHCREKHWSSVMSGINQRFATKPTPLLAINGNLYKCIKIGAVN